MQKVLDKDLEKAIETIIKASMSEKDAAHEIVESLRETQDASGVKVCQVKNW